MPGFSSGGDGVATIVTGFIGASVIITLTTGSYFHWPFVVAGIFVGLMAARSIR